MRERRKNERPEYEEIRGMITKIISKYKRILRTKDEMDDLQQDAYIVYCEMADYIERKYGNEVRNFNTMLYNAISWEINRLVDRKYLLIKKSFQVNRDPIYSTDVDPSILLDLEDDYDFDTLIVNKISASSLLEGLNDIERFVIVKNFGLDSDEIMSLSSIAEILGISYYKVCNTKKNAIVKIKRRYKKEYGYDRECKTKC